MVYTKPASFFSTTRCLESSSQAFILHVKLIIGLGMLKMTSINGDQQLYAITRERRNMSLRTQDIRSSFSSRLCSHEQAKKLFRFLNSLSASVEDSCLDATYSCRTIRIVDFHTADFIFDTRGSGMREPRARRWPPTQPNDTSSTLFGILHPILDRYHYYHAKVKRHECAEVRRDTYDFGDVTLSIDDTIQHQPGL